MYTRSIGSSELGERHPSERVSLRDGSTVLVHPLTAGDEPAIESWFAGLGEETRYARFLAPITRLDRRTCADLASVDHRDREAITAVAPDGSTVGIARYIRLPQPGTAEVAVAVADRWSGRGLASLLLRHVAARARAGGIHTFTALCLESNAAVIRLLSRLGPTTVDGPDGGLVELTIELMDAPGEAR